MFLILVTSGIENKLHLLWKETGKRSQFNISADDGIKLLQIIERFISPHSIEVDEEVARIYKEWIRIIPTDSTTFKNFLKFFHGAEVCRLVRTSLEVHIHFQALFLYHVLDH